VRCNEYAGAILERTIFWYLWFRVNIFFSGLSGQFIFQADYSSGK
jgi:hypothetical protein